MFNKDRGSKGMEKKRDMMVYGGMDIKTVTGNCFSKMAAFTKDNSAKTRFMGLELIAGRV